MWTKKNILEWIIGVDEEDIADPLNFWPLVTRSEESRYS